MEHKTTPTPPQWVEDMQKWQKGDNEHRAVLCVATDLCDTFAALGGYSLPIVMALLANTIKERNFDDIVKGTYLVRNNPSELGILLETWKEFKQEHGFPMDDDETEKKSDFKSTVKDFLHTLADKL